MYHVSAQSVDERTIKVHYYYYCLDTGVSNLVFYAQSTIRHRKILYTPVEMGSFDSLAAVALP